MDKENVVLHVKSVNARFTMDTLNTLFPSSRMLRLIAGNTVWDTGKAMPKFVFTGIVVVPHCIAV